MIDTYESRICKAVVTKFYMNSHPYCEVEYNQDIVECAGKKEVKHYITLVHPKDDYSAELALKSYMEKLLSLDKYKFYEEKISDTDDKEKEHKEKFIVKRYVLHKYENPCHPFLL